ncbi:MAG: hypothetical protein K2M36_00020, partial [Clostridia bacterium]|nr:hypothetical protein [Clostridia bacterium]
NKQLRRNESYGTSAQKIYSYGCENFGWKPEKAVGIGRGTPMFAGDATPRGYSVWFLVYTNLSGTGNANWSNEIIGDKILEHWSKIPDRDYFNDKSDRLTFAKINNEYVFLGLYAYDSTKGNVKTYRRIADIYFAK